MINDFLQFTLEHSISLRTLNKSYLTNRLFKRIRYENVNLSRRSISPNQTRDGNSGVAFLWMD